MSKLDEIHKLLVEIIEAIDGIIFILADMETPEEEDWFDLTPAIEEED